MVDDSGDDGGDGGDDMVDDGGDDMVDGGGDDDPDFTDTGADDGPPPPSLCGDFEPEPIPGLAQATFEKDEDSDGPRLKLSSRWFECGGPFNWPGGDDCQPLWNFSVSLPPNVAPGVYDLQDLFVTVDVQMAGCDGFGSGGAGIPGYLEIFVIDDDCVGGSIWGVNDFPVNGGFVAVRC